MGAWRTPWASWAPWALWVATWALAVGLEGAAPRATAVLLEEERPATFLTASVGEHVVFNCQLDFPHDIVIPYILRWNKGGRTVFSWYANVLTADEDYIGRVNLVSADPRYGKGSVNLTSIRETDSGWYECIVFFPNRTPSTRRNGTWYHLTVDAGTLLAIPPINQTTLEGQPAHFPCVTKDGSASVVWFKDGEELSTVTALNSRYYINPEGSLTIEPTDMTDPGEYTCVVTNGQGDRQTASAFLNVQYKAKVVYSPRERYLPYGRPGILDCHFRANPPLTNLRWEKDGFLFDPYNVQGVFYHRNGSLYFSKVDESHGGHYTCTPINELGTQGPSSPTEVIVQRAPVFTVTPHNLYFRKSGDTLELPCDAVDGSDRHRPSIVWFRKDGLPLPRDRVTFHNGNLTIQNLRDSDGGLYQCVASNEAATISSDTEVLIENAAPRAPYNLSAISDAGSVTLRWVPGSARPSGDYSVWYRPVESSEWHTMRVPTKGTTQATVSGLNSDRSYEFMVVSQDQQGDWMHSKRLQVKTKGSPAEDSSAQEFRSPLGSLQKAGPPRNVSVAPAPADAGWLVTWEPPEVGRDAIKRYTVHWSEGPDDTPHGRADTQETWVLVPHLPEDASYVFQVVATAHDNSAWASEKVALHVAGSRRMRALALGVAAGAAFLALAAAAGWYARRAFQRRAARAKEDGY
ncbi:hypothetical protein R5R35_014160 [Gryllus longicercus]